MDVSLLPSVNAAFNAGSALFLILGYVLIRQRKRHAHRVAMLAALACSVLFLSSYLYYHYHAGSTRFPGTGVMRTTYLSILLSHTVLAAAVPFLAGVTVYRAFRGRFEKHRAIARWTLPIWLYVSVTGVVIYWMLYRMSW
jgi:putative membrane protein